MSDVRGQYTNAGTLVTCQVYNPVTLYSSELGLVFLVNQSSIEKSFFSGFHQERVASGRGELRKNDSSR